MEIKDNRLVGREERIEISIGQAMAMAFDDADGNPFRKQIVAS